MKSEDYKWDWMDFRLMQYNEILQDVKGRASIVRAEAKLDYFRQVGHLEQQYNKFKEKYQHFHEISDEEQDNMQETLEKSWSDLEQSFVILIKGINDGSFFAK